MFSICADFLNFDNCKFYLYLMAVFDLISVVNYSGLLLLGSIAHSYIVSGNLLISFFYLPLNDRLVIC